ncbi:exosortase A [Paucibacter sp. Y2R2-4]|uniref:exosortase A n=1 Tax=Paucibacter sp. Y2R2-4 TaxID=2893553 RepID=UPI0021E37365|nr:exosortase A [Paucibacter sp. Y2R2-4]MCV2348572.1 exosortase A [Paucibacter sp. Y2R2-4]
MRVNLPIPPAWRQALACLVLALLAVLFLYRDTAIAMVEIWHRSETYAHAFVVPPISLWLIWRQRSRLAQLQPSPAWGFLIAVAACACIWLLGELVFAHSMTQLALVGMLVFVVPAVLGLDISRLIAFPLGFLFFAVPMGDFMTPYLMEWTADFTVSALRLSGIPVYREGQDFVIPSGNWSVVEACSGIRYLMASVMVGTLFAYLNFNALKKRVLFVFVAFFLPILANWFRAYFIVMLGHFSGNKLAVGADHLVYGWVFFGIIMLAMFMVGARWSDPEQPVNAYGPVPGLTSSRALAPQWGTVLVVLALLCLPIRALTFLDNQNGAAEIQLRAPDLTAQGWQPVALPAHEWVPKYEKSAASRQQTYRKADLSGNDRAVTLFVAYYRAQSYQSKLISSGNELTRSQDQDWATVSQNVGHLQLHGISLPLRSAELRGRRVVDAGGMGHPQRLAVRYLFWVDGRLTSKDATAKLYGALSRLQGRGDDGAAIFVSAEQDEMGSADVLVEEFLRDNWGKLTQMLQLARDSAHNEALAR